MNKFMDNFMNTMGRIGSQKHLVAIRDSFAMAMPIIIAGSLSVLLNNVHVLFGMESTFLPAWLQTFNGNVWWGSIAMLTLFIVVLIGYNLGKAYNLNPISTAVVSLSSYLCIVPQVSGAGNWGNISWAYTQASSLFVGMLIAIVASEIFIKLSGINKLTIKMPDGVPPAVARSFASLIPGVITLYAVVAFVYLFELAFNATIFAGQDPMNIFHIVDAIVASPVRNVADTLWAALVYVFFVHFLWFFGLHGTNILEGIVQPIFLPLLEANIQAFSNGQAIPHIVTKQFFDTYVFMGGAGTTLGLVIAIFLASKNKARRAVATIGAPAVAFNINEPIIFGLPIVLNPLLFVPFILVPMVLTTVSYFAVSMGLAGHTIAMGIWSMPPILSAFLTTDKPLMSALLQIINICISVAIYIPFVVAIDKIDAKKEATTA